MKESNSRREFLSQSGKMVTAAALAQSSGRHHHPGHDQTRAENAAGTATVHSGAGRKTD